MNSLQGITLNNANKTFPRPTLIPSHLKTFPRPTPIPSHLKTFPRPHLKTLPPSHLKTFPRPHLKTLPPSHLKTFQGHNLSHAQVCALSTRLNHRVASTTGFKAPAMLAASAQVLPTVCEQECTTVGSITLTHAKNTIRFKTKRPRSQPVISN